MIAEQMNKYIPEIDMAIYNKSFGESSLRAIGSIKIKDGKIDKSRIIIPQCYRPD
jgi:hypothetical protein